MDAHSRILTYTLSNFFFYLFLLTTVPQSQSQKDDGKYIMCSRTYNCGNEYISYPFWGGNRPHYCGRDGFEVTCQPNRIASFQISSQNFSLMDINPTLCTVKMVRTDIQNYDDCSFHFTSTSLDPTLFSYDTSVENISLFYDCIPGFSIGRNNIPCRGYSEKQAFFVDQALLRQFPELVRQCRVQIQVPITQGIALDPMGGIVALKSALDSGFDVQYKADFNHCEICMQSGGVCGMEDDTSQFSCHCRDGSYDLACPAHASMASFFVPSIRPFNCSATCISVFCSCHRLLYLLHRISNYRMT